jgi:Domain of unknown function (DUF4296)
MRVLIFFLFLFLMIGCINKDKTPPGIIARDSMPRILWDVIVADQFSKQFILKDSAKINTRLETMKLYQQVFQLHHITRDEFQKSYQFYIARPDLMKIIFDSLSVYSNKQRQEIYKPIKPKLLSKPPVK